MSSRREFLKGTLAALGAGLLGALGAGCGAAVSPLMTGASGSGQSTRPNFLLVLVDQLRLPPEGYGPEEGEADGLKEIFGFSPQLSANNPYTPFFPGFTRLRRNAVVLRRHYIAAAACAPSRATLITGQYPSFHGVTQVNGIFKGATEITWLAENGAPTAGDWLRAAGYETYYFGKWHVSNGDANNADLNPWGFCCWESSAPEPHGSNVSDLGVYRDPGFANIVTNFFADRAATPTAKPWFAVASFVNPHDIAAWPSPFYFPGEVGVVRAPAPLINPQPVPPQGTISNTDPTYGAVPLNPDGFPQDTFRLPQTTHEDLTAGGKPDCQLDQAWKVQVGLRSLFPDQLQPINPYPLQREFPFSEEWALRYGQFYVYLTYLVEQELERILASLDANGLTDNTIILFTSDHGEYAMCHGKMLQKWHSGYEEAVRVPMVVSSPLVNPDSTEMREVQYHTSHIDLVPTLLGLAGYGPTQLASLKQALTGHTVADLVGADLSGQILGRTQAPPTNGDGSPRPGVLFTTDDLITELPQDVAQPEKQEQYDDFLGIIGNLIGNGAPLVPGPVRQPNHVRLLCSGEWKITRYFDPSGANADQWEVYHLPTDPRETTNLVNYRTGQARTDVSVPGLPAAELNVQVRRLQSELAAQEQKVLLTSA